MNKENKHCCLIPIVTLYNVLRYVIITLVLLIIICTWHYVTIKLLSLSKTVDDLEAMSVI